MAYRQRKTKERGYGGDHQRTRREHLDAFIDGQRCPFCDQPMYASQQLDLDHTTDRSGYRGLAHMHCNRSEGAKRGSNKNIKTVTFNTRHSRNW